MNNIYHPLRWSCKHFFKSGNVFVKRMFLFVLLAQFFVGESNGQQLALWSPPPAWSGIAASPLAASAVAANVSSATSGLYITSIERYNLGGVSSTGRYNSDNWTDPDAYLVINVSAASGYVLNLAGKTVVINLGSSNQGPNGYVLFSNVDNYGVSLGSLTTTTAAASNSPNTINIPNIAAYNNLTSITFHLTGNHSGVGASGGIVGTGGTGGPSYVQVNGTTSVAPPVITNTPLTASTTYGTSFTYQINATSATAMTYSVTTATPGLSVSVNGTGLVTATVTSALIPASTYSFDITATNGIATTKTIALTVTPRPITITATGPPMTYGNPLASTIPGSASFSLTSGSYAFTESVTSVTLTPDANGQSATLSAGSAYSVEPSAAAGINGFIASNYSITYANYNSTVTKKPLTVTANIIYKSQGTALATPVTNNTDFTVSGLENGQTVGSITMSYGTGAAIGDPAATYVNQAVPSAATGGTFNINNYAVTYVPGNIQVVSGAIPLITSSGSPVSLSTNFGTASTFTSFNIAGTNMLAGILVTPPTGFEVALASGGPYTATVTVGAAGTIASTPVYIRIKSTTNPGSYSGFIVCSSASASNENVSMPVSTVNALAPTVQATNLLFASVTSLTFNVSWTNGNGGRRVVFIKDGTGLASTPIDGNQYSADPNFGSGQELVPGNGFYCIYDGTGSSVNVTGLNPGITYTVQVFEYNSDDNTAPTASFIKYNTNSNATNPQSQATASPTINVSTATLTGFAYYENYGPSSSLNYTLSATNLTTPAGIITVGSAADYEYSIDNINFSNSLSINYTAYNLASTIIYVRLKSGLTAGAYNGQDIINSGGGAAISPTVTCNGNVITAPAGSANPIVAWNFAGNNSTTSPYLGYSSGTPVSGISSTGITRGSGIVAAAVLNTMGGTSYTNTTSANAIAGSDFFTFDLTLDGTHTASLFSIAPYNIRKSAAGPTTIQWQYNTGSGFLDLPGGGPITIGAVTTNAGNPQLAISLGSISALQNLAPGTTVTFRLILYGATNAGGTGYLNITGGTNNIAILGTVESYCGGADAIEFVSPPSDVIQDATMNSVTVRAFCTSNGATDKVYAKTVTIASAAAPLYVCGLTGTLSQTFFNGIATYSNIKITRSAQSGVKLIASTSAPAPILSITTADASNTATFNVIAPLGTGLTTTEIARDDFEGNTATATYPWPGGRTVLTSPSGTGSGTDDTRIKTLGGNKTLVKSFSQDNVNPATASNPNTKSSTTTITFANQNIPSTVDYTTFTFQVASLGDPSSPNGTGYFSGEGNDNQEDMFIEISLDGGTVWSKTLTFKGNDGYVFPFSGTVTKLAYNANAVYSGTTALSSFEVKLPTGSTKFRFRMTATNNRINENWALDNIKLESTTLDANTPSPLPIVTSNPSVVTCPATNTTISVVTGSTQGAVAYSWIAGGTGSIIGLTTVSNPTVSITGPGAGTFDATITDADGCKTSSTVTVTLPTGSTGDWTGAVNSDWYQCGNWGGGVVPINTTDVKILSSASHVADIDPLSSYYTGTNAKAQTIAIDKGLTMKANGILDVSSVSGGLTINTGGSIDMTYGGVINLFGSWTNNVGAAAFTAGAGTINYAGSGAQTVAPENYKNLTISLNGTRTVTLSPSGTIGVDSIFTPAASTTTYVVANSTVDFGGANLPQTIPAFTFYNVGFKNGDTKTLGGAINVQKTLTVGASTTFALSSSNVTLRSINGLTANVATVPVSATINQGGAGNFIIERFANGVRGWRFLTAPTTTTQTLRASWMEGSTPAVSPIVPATMDKVKLYGTHITGPSPAANGFDDSPRDNYSIKYYDETTFPGTFKGTGITTAGTNVTDRKGWMLFIRGDRSYDILNTTQFMTPNDATLRTTGKINVGDVAVTIPVTTSGYTVVGNPYPSAIEFSNVTKSPSATANDIYSIWDPRLGGSSGNGGWITMTRSTGTTYSPSVSPVSDIDVSTGRIESGVAILVAKANLNSLTIKEADKSNTSASLLFRPQPAAVSSSLRTTLYEKSDDGTRLTVDGSLHLFDRSYSNTVDAADGYKPQNATENWGIKSGNNVLAIEKRNLPAAKDTIHYNMVKMNAKNYLVEFKTDNINGNNLVGYVVDKYLKSYTKLNMQGTTQVEFKVINEAGTYAADRFIVVFRKQANYTSIKAAPFNNDVAVDWKVDEENDVNHYEVERSTDKVSFKNIGTVYTNNKMQELNYSLLDKDAVPGIYYYRIKAVGETGATGYSEIAKVTVISNHAPMLVFPNPVTANTINLQMNSQPKGFYSVKLLNGHGQMVAVKLVNHAGGTATQVIRPNNKLAAGTYQLEVTGPDKTKTSLRVVVVQDK